MAILGAEIGLAIMAIIVLATGKLSLTRERAVYGTPARLLAVFGLLPFPLSFIVGFVVGSVRVARGLPPVFEGHLLIYGAIEFAMIGLCLAAMYGIGWSMAGLPPSSPSSLAPPDEPFAEEPEPPVPDTTVPPVAPSAIAAGRPPAEPIDRPLTRHGPAAAPDSITGRGEQ